MATTTQPRTAGPRPAAARGEKARARTGSVVRYAALIAYSVLAVGPILLVVVNSFKTRAAIFDHPLSLPTSETFSLEGYKTVFAQSYVTWLSNTVFVTVATVLITLVFGSLAAFAFARYDFVLKRTLHLYVVAGILLPTILGTVFTLRLFADLGLVNNLWSVILVTSAQSLPLSVFLLTQFISEVPSEIYDAARVDGAGEGRLFLLTLPLIRPGLGAVAVLTTIPVWNDLWWPLILAPGRTTSTLVVGLQRFVGQFATDYNALLAALTMAMVPMFVVFALFSRQLIRGLTSGAVK